MKTTKYTNKELVEIYKNLKTSAKILGFASASDCEMMVAIELEAVKRHLNLIDGTVEETAERQKDEVRTMKYTMQELKDIYREASARSESEDYEHIAGRVECVLKGETKCCRFQLFEKDLISACFVEDDDVCIVNGTYDEHVKRYGNHAELVMKMYGVKKAKAQTAETAVTETEQSEKAETVEQTEVEETAEIETAKPETVETEEKAEEEIITMANTNTNASIAKAEEKKTQFDFYNVTIGFDVEKFIGTIYDDYEGIYSDYEKAVQAAQAAADEYGAENIYFHTVEIATRNDREVYDRDDYEDFIEERETIRHNWYTLTIMDTGKIEHVNLDKPVRLDFKE